MVVIVTGGGHVRRSKRGVVAYGRSKTSGIQARDFWVFTIATGAVVAVAAAAAFAVIGWWALIPGVVVGLIVALLSWYFSKKWTKHTVAVWLKKLDETLETNPNYLPDVELKKDGPKVEAILTILLVDHNRLESKLGKYYGTDEAKARERLKKAFDQSAGRSDLSTTLKKVKGSKADLDDDDGADIRKLSILIARERTYIRFAYKYMTTLQAKIQEYYDFLPDVDTAVSQFVDRQVGLHPFHDACNDNCCFGPRPEDLDIRPASQAYLQNIMGSGQSMGTKMSGYAASQRTRGAPAVPPANGVLDELDEDDDYTWGDVLIAGGEHATALSVAAVSEALEGTLPEAVAEAAGGTAADLLLSPIGFVVGVIVSEAIQSATVNRPTRRRAAKIRDAIENKDGQELDEDIMKRVRKNKPEMLTRALNKIHSNYLKRMSDRFEKLEKAYDRIRRGPDNPNDPTAAWPYTCTDAVNITRYLLKIYHYCEKAYSHIVMIQASVEAIEKRLAHMETLANRAMPAPPAPPPPANP